MRPDLTQLCVYVAGLMLLCPLLGIYLSRVLDPKAGSTPRLERWLYRCCGIDEQREQHWSEYLQSLLTLNVGGVLLLMSMLMLQGWLPLNPANTPGMSWHLALNTAVSFVTNTNWQSYAGESSVSALCQMLGLTLQNFLSPATGIAVLLAMIRGFTRVNTDRIGNYWADMTRSVIWVLLPISCFTALLLVWQGVPQTFDARIVATTLEGSQQTIPLGAIASQEAIKMIGTNGGGYFNANSAHPYENPTPLSNMIEMLSILLLPGALVMMFGRMLDQPRQARALFVAMLIPLLLGVAICTWAEQQGNPFLIAAGADPAGGNMEGKEVRFGISGSSLFAVITTAASCGAVNAMHDSFTALGGLVPMVMIQLGEVIFGGVGSGLYGMLIFAVLTVFIAGLMVGRTPEYLGKKIEAREIKLVVFAGLLPMPLGTLIVGATAIAFEAGRVGILNPGPHGLSELLYAYTSATGNNGSAFAGLSANTPFHNVLLTIAITIGRYLPIAAVLAIAGSLANKKRLPVSAGTFPTDRGLFVALLIGVILIVGALTYFPVLALGPVAEQLSATAGRQF